MSAHPFTAGDLADLSAHGIALEAALEQLRLYETPPPPARLERMCTPGDGILCLGDEQAERYAQKYDRAAEQLAVAKFVPASGAASRMFRALLATAADERAKTLDDLIALAGAGSGDAKATLEVVQNLPRLALYEDLRDLVARRGATPEELAAGDLPALLSALLSDDGLGYAGLPKGLLVFHRDGGERRTAFEEHLVEAAMYARGRGGVCRLHFTVSPEHEQRFRELLERVRPRYEQRFGVRYEVGFSHQKPSTDAIAVDPSGAPFRDRSGKLLFRPAGHGALIENLGEVDADILFIKNIDNVTVDALKPLTSLWKRVLAGVLLELRDKLARCGRAIETGDSGAVDAALEMLEKELGAYPPQGASAAQRRELALERLGRPLRVCGMLSSDTNPGGGPFWVRDAHGNVSAQIVEVSQVDRNDPVQRALLEGSKYFNPVDVVCTTRNWKGERLDLARYVDHEAVFIAEKSQDGRPLRSLERPGLWNGAMAGWNTLFVAVPAQTFHPVKTLNDLLLPAHQGPGA
ncbi:MAG TPA: DUF4301 family protein [Candidatus Limnocylindrales bacterium]|nr:DUF4301 family protein [Candidatus Limnocylindrales bacterium]